VQLSRRRVNRFAAAMRLGSLLSRRAMTDVHESLPPMG